MDTETNLTKSEAIIVASSAPPSPPLGASLTSLLTYGGISVAVILAMAAYSKIQFEWITKLVKTLKSKK